MRYLVNFAIALALIVIILGAYTRLTHAGLGCPDWPGCYGQLLPPSSANTIAQAEQDYPNQQLQTKKAWTEMIHRYAAGILGLTIFILASLCLYYRRRRYFVPLFIPMLLVVLIMLQATLGMWTVTWQLLPLVVLGHLVGGILTLASLWWFRLQLAYPNHKTTLLPHKPLNSWLTGGIAILFMQIILGGWVSANYAGLACIGFPHCNGELWPGMHLTEAFQLLSPIGVNYEGGTLTSSARITIQMVHRIGALITLVYVGLLMVWVIIKKPKPSARTLALFILLLLLTQLGLGIMNVVAFLPLSIALAHNSIAVLLFIGMLTLCFKLNNP